MGAWKPAPSGDGVRRELADAPGEAVTGVDDAMGRAPKRNRVIEQAPKTFEKAD